MFLGAPVYGNLGPKPVMRFLERLRDGSPVLAAAPEQPGHYAVVFCTYGGGHTGVDEAVPFLKYMGQVFAHHGVRVVEEWPVAGEFKGVKDPDYNASGRLGSVVGRPDQRDLDEVSGRVAGLLRRLQHLLGIESLLVEAVDLPRSGASAAAVVWAQGLRPISAAARDRQRRRGPRRP